MKKLFTFAVTMILGASLTFAQTGGDKSTLNPQPLPPGKHPATATPDTATKTKTKMHHKHHKGGKKSKKGSSSTTPPPK